MPDIPSITGALSALKVAADVAKTLRELDRSMQSADLRLKIADLTEALATAKMSLSEVQETLAEKDAEISRLESALVMRAEVVRYGDSYYQRHENGQPVGDPFCSYCFEMKHVLVHTNQNPKDRSQSICPNCKNFFHWQRRRTVEDTSPGD